jgi:plastocyanin
MAASVVFLLSIVLAIPVLASHLPPGGTFSDDDDSVHEGYIEALVEEGITTGCGAGKYCPEQPVTRGQMAAFLNRALPLPPGSGDTFADDDESEFEGDIERLAASGVTRGCNPPDNNLFCPDAPVTRGQMAAFLVRAFEYTDGAGSDRFADDDDSEFESDIERLAEAGVTLGCNPPDNTNYCPDKPVTRAEMATFLGRALGLTPHEPPPPASSTTSTTEGDTTSTTDDDDSTTSTSLPMLVEVDVLDSVFSPSTIVIAEGGTVLFTDAAGGMPHNVVWEDGSPGSGAPSAAGWTHERTFTDSGTYRFFCEVHGAPGGVGMSGMVIVES